MIKPREKTPDLNINLINGTEWTLSQQDPKNFTLVIVYRGLHCPVCKKYLENLQTKLSEFDDLGVNIIAVSSDTEETAKKTYDEWDIGDVPLGYEFPIEEARKWGLFISKGIKDEPETFIEPGLFLIRPNQELYCASIQTMPFARPGLDDMIKAIKFTLKEDYPARGEA
ncbi:peroxiredoxin-like family protein [Winogradskyella bathintestinalis]|uniref:Peroxiredoxin-like family protein n=1 Tax=Winogradskyella bathintestinalis TaxID=3035208 RepID=A0ABT7ZXS2_9FLAO|nr:peroxiredoxin-like family protein [Winogradskyella bathintestinalis]MDN3493797.1 peroxiredoxin-like family protein [Winogradskyella bathintestinalis]